MKARLLACAAAASVLAAAPAAGDGSCLDGDIAFADAAVRQAIESLSDQGLDAAGEKALEKLYENALKNTPTWPVGAINTNFTSSAEAPLLKDSPWAKVLKNLTKVRDAVIRPMEAIDSGDESAAWKALGEFGADLAMEQTIAAALGEGPGAIVHAAVKVAQASHEALEQETCLLGIDLEFYNATMHDPQLGPANREKRVDYYLASYLLGIENAPSGYPREEHRKRLQCYIDTELSPEERAEVFDTTFGQRTPFDRIWDTFRTMNARGDKAANRGLRTAVGAMLHDFDARAQWEDAKAKLRTVRATPEYITLTEAIAKAADPEKVASNFCAAYQKALAALSGPESTPPVQAQTEADPVVRPESIRCDFALCKAEGAPRSPERDQCLQAAALRWRSVEPCRRAANPAACAAPALLLIGNAPLIKEFVREPADQDELLGVLIVKDRNRSALPLINDNERHDGMVTLSTVMAHDFLNGDLPPPTWCDQMRGNFQGDYPDDADMYRNQCEAMVAALHSLGGEDKCKTALPQRVRERDTEDLAETQVAAANLCYGVLDVVANIQNLSPAQVQSRLAGLTMQDAASSGREMTLPDLGDVDIDTSQDPVIGAPAVAADPDYRWCGRGADPVVALAEPQLDGEALDVCVNYGVECWKPAADAWCRRQGLGASVSFASAGGKRTKTQGEGKICEGSHCLHFSSINCAASPEVESDLPPPGTALCPILAQGSKSTLDQSEVLVMTYFGGATHYYRHPQQNFLCAYGTIHSSDFTGEYLFEESGGYAGYILDGDDMKLIGTYTQTGTSKDASGADWMTGTWENAEKTKSGAWNARWMAR